ncbi:MAG: alpha/beta fold hydrolase [Spirochaetales bacterium]|nr:alpha/beta fold hydrolase [Spirochaetales bacterium]
MKTLLKSLLVIAVLLSMFTGCTTTKVSETADYAIKSYNVEIPARDSVIPASVIIPSGEGRFPLVVMAHGHGGTKDENGGFTNIAEELGRHGIATVRMDFPGCGESTESFQLNTLSNMIDDVDSSIAYLLENYSIDKDRTGIFGYSMGGRIALAMATDGMHNFDGMVLLAPAGDADTMVGFLGGQEAWDGYYATAQADGYTDFTTIFGAKQELSLEWFEDLLAYDPIDKGAEFKGEALVIFGEDDFVVQPAVSKATAAALGCETLDVTGDTHSYSFYSDSPEIRSAILNGTIKTFRKAFN